MLINRWSLENGRIVKAAVGIHGYDGVRWKGLAGQGVCTRSLVYRTKYPMSNPPSPYVSWATMVAAVDAILPDDLDFPFVPCSGQCIFTLVFLAPASFAFSSTDRRLDIQYYSPATVWANVGTLSELFQMIDVALVRFTAVEATQTILHFDTAVSSAQTNGNLYVVLSKTKITFGAARLLTPVLTLTAATGVHSVDVSAYVTAQGPGRYYAYLLPELYLTNTPPTTPLEALGSPGRRRTSLEYDSSFGIGTRFSVEQTA